MSVAFLSYMALVLLMSLVQPALRVLMHNHTDLTLPAKVDTIAGCMYYLCESGMLKDFEGLSVVARCKERDRLVGEMNKLYVFGKVRGGRGGQTPRADGSGAERLGIDYYLVEE